MELILMRHGKAEARSDAKADFEREITSIGRKKVKQAARGLARCLLPGRVILIWTSPSIRTLQTAEILRTAFGKKTKIHVMDAIAGGNLADLQMEWSKIADIDVLLIVAHEPMLSDWTKKLSDVELVFRPASAACIVLDDPVQAAGSLDWFMRAGVLARLCPSVCPHRRQTS